MKQISVDVCTRCSCRCRYCTPHTESSSGNIMPKEMFETIVGILSKEGYDFVYLYGFGEPFLHPLVYDYIDLLRLKKITSDIATKLSCVIDWDRFDRSYPNRLLVTLDSLKPDVMKKIAPGISPELVFRNLESLSKVYARRHHTQRLIFNTTVCSLNYDELGDIRSFLIERFKLFERPLIYGGKAMGIGFGCTTSVQVEKAIAVAGDLWTDKFTECRFRIEGGGIVPLYDKRCWPKGQICEPIPVINPQGHLTPCCHDAFSACSFGDVLKLGSVDGLLNGSAGRKVMIAAKQMRLPICKVCN